MIARRKPLKRSTKPLKRTPLARVSKKRAKEMRTYSKLRKEFLEAHPWCQVWLKENGFIESNAYMMLAYAGTIQRECPPACDIHHAAGRSGSNYLDTSTWMACSREGHRKIHDNPKWAREMGFLK